MTKGRQNDANGENMPCNKKDKLSLSNLEELKTGGGHLMLDNNHPK